MPLTNVNNKNCIGFDIIIIYKLYKLKHLPVNSLSNLNFLLHMCI